MLPLLLRYALTEVGEALRAEGGIVMEGRGFVPAGYTGFSYAEPGALEGQAGSKRHLGEGSSAEEAKRFKACGSPPSDEPALGRRIRILWPVEESPTREPYEGLVVGYDGKLGHSVRYEDGDSWCAAGPARACPARRGPRSLRRMLLGT